MMVRGEQAGAGQVGAGTQDVVPDLQRVAREMERVETEVEHIRTEVERVRTEMEHARKELEHARTQMEHARKLQVLSDMNRDMKYRRRSLLRDFIKLSMKVSHTAPEDRERYIDLVGRILSQLLELSTRQQASDLRDKIFGTYDILEKLVPGFPDVDYSQDPELIYEGVSRHIIRKSRSLSIVVLSSRIEKRQGVAMPSWVPDWGYFGSDGIISKPMTQPVETLRTSVHVPTLNSYGQGKLALRGKRMAYLSSRTSAITSQLEWPHVCTNGPMVSVLRHWYLSVRSSTSLQGTTEDGMTAITEALGCQTRSSGEQSSLDLLKLVVNSIKGGKLDANTTSQQICNLIHPERSRGTASLRWMDSYILFHTSSGNIGLCVADTQPHDVIVLLAGTSSPVLLRPEEDYYRYIGPVYIHGVTDGSDLWAEGTDVEALETFILV